MKKHPDRGAFSLCSIRHIGVQRGKQSYGICRYKVNLGVLQTPIYLVYSEDGTPMPRDELYQALGLDMVDW